MRPADGAALAAVSDSQDKWPMHAATGAALAAVSVSQGE